MINTKETVLLLGITEAQLAAAEKSSRTIEGIPLPATVSTRNRRSRAFYMDDILEMAERLKALRDAATNSLTVTQKKCLSASKANGLEFHEDGFWYSSQSPTTHFDTTEVLTLIDAGLFQVVKKDIRGEAQFVILAR